MAPANSINSKPIPTDRLSLRRVTAADAQALFAIFSNADVMRYWSTPPMTDPAQAEKKIADALDAYCSELHLLYGIERTADKTFIGTCTLFNINAQNRRADIGYALGRPNWGAGFMHEALSALVGYAFGAMNLLRLEADIDPRNLASAKTLDRLGFQREGYLRERWIVNGEVSDSILYGLLSRDWPTRAAKK